MSTYQSESTLTEDEGLDVPTRSSVTTRALRVAGLATVAVTVAVVGTHFGSLSSG